VGALHPMLQQQRVLHAGMQQSPDHGSEQVFFSSLRRRPAALGGGAGATKCGAAGCFTEPRQRACVCAVQFVRRKDSWARSTQSSAGMPGWRQEGGWRLDAADRLAARFGNALRRGELRGHRSVASAPDRDLGMSCAFETSGVPEAIRTAYVEEFPAESSRLSRPDSVRR